MAIKRAAKKTVKKTGKSKSAAKGISWDPEDGEQAGLLNDVNVTITSAQCTVMKKDYSGEGDVSDPEGSSPCLMLEIEVDGWEGDNPPKPIYLSGGSLTRVVPDDDGERFIPADGSSATGLSTSSNAWIFMKSLVDAGFPVDKLQAGISTLEGLYFHLVRQPQPKRSGLDQEDDRPRTVPICDEILRLPWEKAGKTGKPKKTAKPADEDEDDDEEEEDDEEEDQDEAEDDEEDESEDSEGEDDEDEDEDEDEEDNTDLVEASQAAVVKVLSDPKYKKTGIAKSKLYGEIMDVIKTSPQRKKILEMVQDEEFLGDEDAPWTVKGDKLLPA